MFLEYFLSALHEYKRLERTQQQQQQSSSSKSASTNSNNKKRSRSRSPVSSSSTTTTPSHPSDLPLFHVSHFSELWSELLNELVSILSTGVRSEGCESEYLHLARLVRQVTGVQSENGLPHGYSRIIENVRTLIGRLPQLRLPLTLRSQVAEKVKGGLVRLEELWIQDTKMDTKHLIQLLEYFEGDLKMVNDFDVTEEEEEEEDEEEEEKPSADDVVVPAAKKQRVKKSSKNAEAPDALAPSRSIESLFFIDNGAAASTTAAAVVVDGVDSSESSKDRDEEASMGRTMEKILAGITPQDLPKSKGKKATKGKKAASNEEEDAANVHDGEVDPSDALALELEAAAAAEADGAPASTPMEVVAEPDAGGDSDNESVATRLKSRAAKRAASTAVVPSAAPPKTPKSRSKKATAAASNEEEIEEIPAAPTTVGRAKRAKK